MVNCGEIDDDHKSRQNNAAMHARKAFVFGGADMKQQNRIVRLLRLGLTVTLVMPLAAVLGCVSTTAPARARLASAKTPEVMMIVMDGKKTFTVFVEPNNVERARALTLATAKASGYCRKAYGSAKIEFTKIKRRSWGVPDAWQIDGTCT